MPRPSRRPTIRKGPAAQYAMPGELIMEFSDGQSGGLLSLRRHPDGKLLVSIYQQDADVEVHVGEARASEGNQP